MNIKNTALIIPCMMGAIYTNTAHSTVAIGGGGSTINPPVEIAKGCTQVECPSSTMALPFLFMEEACSSHASERCYSKNDKTYVIKPCSACYPGYRLIDGPIDSCPGALVGSAGPNIPHCECICSNCSSTNWTNIGTGYQYKITRNCECISGTPTCNEDTSYQCAAGYWGRPTNSTSGCSPCPTWTGVYTNSARTTSARGTSSAGATEITGCYVTPGTYYDVTGTFTISSNCSYTN